MFAELPFIVGAFRSCDGPCFPTLLFGLFVVFVVLLLFAAVVAQVRPARGGAGEEGDDPDRQHVSKQGRKRASTP